MLSYPLPTALLNKTLKLILNGIVTMIHRAAKSIIGLSENTNNDLFYFPWKWRGLGLINREAYLLHFAVSKKLENIKFLSIYDTTKEKQE